MAVMSDSVGRTNALVEQIGEGAWQMIVALMVAPATRGMLTKTETTKAQLMFGQSKTMKEEDRSVGHQRKGHHRDHRACNHLVHHHHDHHHHDRRRRRRKNFSI